MSRHLGINACQDNATAILQQSAGRLSVRMFFLNSYAFSFLLPFAWYRDFISVFSISWQPESAEIKTAAARKNRFFEKIQNDQFCRRRREESPKKIKWKNIDADNSA
uniref:hypothetical protein n=1 Tax=Candidatus Electronema sp. TaxID=2698783 RepID=UPI0040567E8D